MKKSVLFICTFVYLFVASNAWSQDSSYKIKVGILNGPSCVPCANLMEKDSYEFSKYADPQALLPKLIKSEVDVGFLPVNVAVKVYNSSNHKIICAAVTGKGNLKLVTRNKNIKRLTDLNQSVVQVAGRGATPEYLFRYLLEKNNIVYDQNKSLKLDYSIPTAQIPAMLISEKVEHAVLPEPFATIACMKSKDVYTAIDLQKEYSYFAGKENFPLTVMVVRSDFALEHQNELEAFLNDYAVAAKECVKNPKNTARLCQKYDLGLSEAVVSASIPKSNYVFVRAEKSVEEIEEFMNIFLEFEPSSIGGALPDSDFYYHGENFSQ